MVAGGCIDRNAGLPVDGSVRHALLCRLYLRLLLDVASPQSTDGPTVDAVKPKRLLSRTTRRHASRRCSIHTRHQCPVRPA